MQTAETFDITASAIQLNALDAVTVGTTGAVVELSGAGEVEYVSHVWRSSSTFEEFTNAVPLMDDVTEVFVRGVGASVESAGGAVVTLSLGSGVDSSSYVTVWDSTLGAGTYTMDGLHVAFSAQSVSSVRLSVRGGGGLFVGWDEVVFHFGQSVSSGSVRVSSSSVFEAVSGESLSVSSESVSVSAGGTLDVSGGESVRVSRLSVDVLAEEEFAIVAGAISAAAADSIEVISQHQLAATAESLSLSAYGDITMSSGGLIRISANEAHADFKKDLRATAETMDLHAAGSVSATAREKVTLMTDKLQLNTDSIDAYADNKASLKTRNAILQTKQFRTATERLDMKASKSLKFNAVEDVMVESQELQFGGGAGRVRLSSAPKIATAEFEVPNTVADDPEAMMAELADLLGVPMSRLRVQTLEDGEASGNGR